MLRRIIHNALELLFPPSCSLCGEIFPIAVTESSARVCLECDLRLRRIFGRVKVRAVAARTLDGIYSCFAYDGSSREAITRLKFSGALFSLSFFSECLASLYLRYIKDCDVIVPVPMHKEALTKRGFNQSALLASQLSRILGVYAALSGLRCNFRRAEQVGLTASERMENLKGLFTARGDFNGKRVLIVDDVVTTGATIAEAARAIKDFRPLSISALVIAKTL